MLPKIASFWQKIIDNKLYAGVFLIIVFLIGLGGTYSILSLLNQRTGSPKNSQVMGIEPEGAYSPTPLPEPIDVTNSFNVALLGSGGAGHSGGTLTDSIIVISVDPKKKKATM